MMEDDELPLLSEEASAALLEVFASDRYYGQLDTSNIEFTENWSLSQFWYTDETADTICSEIEYHLAEESVACVSCPTIFRKLNSRESNLKRTLFEFDKRFASFENFVFYDYNQPMDIPKQLQCSFDVVVVDPPYLSEECLKKMLQSVKVLLKSSSEARIYLLTGAVMQEIAWQEAQLMPVEFRPQHANKLGNDFLLYTDKQPSHYLGQFQDSCCQKHNLK